MTFDYDRNSPNVGEDKYCSMFVVTGGRRVLLQGKWRRSIHFEG